MVDYESFLKWAESRFDSVVVSGDEIKLNSIFCDDQKHHLWCNPSGGKTSRENGVFHCWKSDKYGSLTSLVMQVDNCSYSDALEILGINNYGSNLAKLEAEMERFFENKKQQIKSIENISLPPYCFWIQELQEENPLKTQAINYLEKRKLPYQKLMVCSNGKYANRIIIPFLDEQNKLIYFNARSLKNKVKPRYLFPAKHNGFGKSDVLYVPKWGRGDIYLTEGELDALSIHHSCGYLSAALGGKSISENQIKIIRKFNRIILALDQDDSGKESTRIIGERLQNHSLTINKEVYCIHPKKPYKDWNEMLCAGENLGAYLKNYHEFNPFIY